MEKDQEEKPLVHFAQAKLRANTGMDAEAEPYPSPPLFADPCGEKDKCWEKRDRGESLGTMGTRCGHTLSQ